MQYIVVFTKLIYIIDFECNPEKSNELNWLENKLFSYIFLTRV